MQPVPLNLYQPFFKESEVDGNKGLKKLLSTGKRAPPRIVTITQVPSENSGMQQPTANYVVFDGCVVNVGSVCTTQAVLTLMATYYVFGLEYPKIFSQALGMAQTFLIRDAPFSGDQTSGYTKLASKLYKKM